MILTKIGYNAGWSETSWFQVYGHARIFPCELQQVFFYEISFGDIFESENNYEKKNICIQ